MKKAMALISLAVLVVLLFASCAGADVTDVNGDIVSDTAVITNDESKVEYNVSLEGHECMYQLFKKETPQSTEIFEQPTKYDGEYEIIQVGDIQLEMKLIQKERSYFRDESTYQLKEYNAELSIFDNDPYKFSMIGRAEKGIGVLKKYEESEFSEEKLIKHCQDYVDEFVNDIDYSTYDYRWETSLSVNAENYRGGLTKKEFYIHDKENDKNSDVTMETESYTLTFCHTFGEYITNDSINIYTFGNGDIYAFKYNRYDVNLSKYALETEELTKIAKDFLDKYLVDDCKLLLFETRPHYIHKTENEVFVFFYIDFSAEYKGKTISRSERLRITFPDGITSMETYG